MKTTTRREARQRAPRTIDRMRITDDERLLLTLYRTAPERVRQIIGGTLCEAWLHPNEAERAGCAQRFAESSKALGTRNLPLTIVDQILGGAR